MSVSGEAGVAKWQLRPLRSLGLGHSSCLLEPRPPPPPSRCSRELLLILTSHLLLENEGAGIWQAACCVFIQFRTYTNTFLAPEGGAGLRVLSFRGKCCC